jgi:hypothetical protein
MLGLSIGLLVSIAIAVGCAVRNPWNWKMTLGLTTIEGREFEAFHCAQKSFDMYEVRAHRAVGRRSPIQPFGYTFPRWVTAPSGEAVGTATLAYGWPMRCLRCGTTDVKEARVLDGAEYMHVVSKEWGMIQLGPRAPSVFSGSIPLVPILTGLAGNTLLYSAIPLGVLIAIPVIRRAARRRRGSCVGCGYDLRGLGVKKCPECGAETATAAT